jgi:hypothetical protein
MHISMRQVTISRESKPLLPANFSEMENGHTIGVDDVDETNCDIDNMQIIEDPPVRNKDDEKTIGTHRASFTLFKSMCGTGIFSIPYSFYLSGLWVRLKVDQNKKHAAFKCSLQYSFKHLLAF